eukprot:1718010-Rhodomonas_salina.1
MEQQKQFTLSLVCFPPLPPPLLTQTCDEIDRSDPSVCLSLDARNAFNTMSRTAIFDAIYGSASRPYDKGDVAP